MIAPQTFFVFNNCDTFEQCWPVVLRTVPQFGFIMLLHDKPEEVYFWQEYHTGIGPFSGPDIRGHMKLSCLHTGDVNLDCLVR